jgi:hypothetical protein
VDEIPHVNDDPVSRLYAHYFLQADTLFRYYKRLAEERNRKGRLSENKQLDEFHLHRLWLASLLVLAEGFETSPIQKALQRWKETSLDLRVYCGSVHHKMTQFGAELKLFRNATFHFQPNPGKHLQFYQVKNMRKPLVWAEDLHREFAMLFSEYRVLHASAYMDQEMRKDQQKNSLAT